MTSVGDIRPERSWQKTDQQLVTLALAVLVFTAGTALLPGVTFPLSQFGLRHAESGVPPRTKNPILIQKAKVLVPKETIWPEQRLNASMFLLAERTIAGIEGRVFFDALELEGRSATSILIAGAPVLREYVNSPERTNPLTSGIPAGEQTMTLDATATNTGAGRIRSGARVDVIWTTEYRGRSVTVSVAEDALVLSAVRPPPKLRAGDTGTPRPVDLHVRVTLLATTTEVRKIRAAQATNGSLTLNVRADPGREDDQMIAWKRSPEGAPPQHFADTNGTVTLDGQEYALRGGRLVPVFEKRQRVAPTRRFNPDRTSLRFGPGIAPRPGGASP